MSPHIWKGIFFPQAYEDKTCLIEYELGIEKSADVYNPKTFCFLQN